MEINAKYNVIYSIYSSKYKCLKNATNRIPQKNTYAQS